MELIFNFEKKELAVNEDCNYLELHKRLKKLFGVSLGQWTIVGREVKWAYQYFPTYIWPDKPLWYETVTGPYQIDYSVIDSPPETVVCLTTTDYENVPG